MYLSNINLEMAFNFKKLQKNAILNLIWQNKSYI